MAWGIAANHGGGYQYRLCPAGEDPTEECFQKTPLEFVGEVSWNVSRMSARNLSNCEYSYFLYLSVTVQKGGSSSPELEHCDPFKDLPFLSFCSNAFSMGFPWFSHGFPMFLAEKRSN